MWAWAKIHTHTHTEVHSFTGAHVFVHVCARVCAHMEGMGGERATCMYCRQIPGIWNRYPRAQTGQFNVFIQKQTNKLQTQSSLASTCTFNTTLPWKCFKVFNWHPIISLRILHFSLLGGSCPSVIQILHNRSCCSSLHYLWCLYSSKVKQQAQFGASCDCQWLDCA